MKDLIFETRGTSMKLSILALALLVGLPGVASAAYKCKQADGSLSYQDAPCPNGSTGAKTALPRVQSVDSPAVPAYTGRSTTTVKTGTSSAASKQMQAEADRAAAFNKSQQCNYDRQQLGVLKSGRRVYSTDNNGDRNYVGDDQRDSKIAEQQQRVYDSCN